MSWVTVLWPPGRYLSAEVSPRLRGSPGRGGNSGRPSRARQLEVEGPGSSGRPCKEGPGLPEPASGGASSDTRSQAGGRGSGQVRFITRPKSRTMGACSASLCLQPHAQRARRASVYQQPEDQSTSLPEAPRQQHTHSRPHGVQHAATAARARGTCHLGRYRAHSAGGAHDRRAVLPHCEYSEYPCEYAEYRRGPGVVRMADGQSCRTAAAVRRNHPRAADARGRCTRSTRLRR